MNVPYYNKIYSIYQKFLFQLNEHAIYALLKN